jgi:hypothetical protein
LAILNDHCGGYPDGVVFSACPKKKMMTAGEIERAEEGWPVQLELT